jgi:hypothetical protein
MSSVLGIIRRCVFVVPFLWFAWSAPALAGGSVNSVDSSHARVIYDHPGYTTKKDYKVCWMLKGSTSWTCMQTNQNTYVMDYLTIGQKYRVRVFCICKGSGKLAIAHEMQIADIEFTFSALSPTVFFPPAPEIVRIRNEKTGLCLYANSQKQVRSLPCGPNQIMHFSVEPSALGDRQIRHLLSGNCIHGGFPNLKDVRTAPCGSFGTMFYVMNSIVDSVTGVWLNIPVTEAAPPGYPPARGPGGCLAGGLQGVEITKVQCINLETRILFHFDPP